MLQEEQILPRLEHVAEAEKVNLTEDGKKALMTLSNGDMRYVVFQRSLFNIMGVFDILLRIYSSRRVLNILQSCSMAFDEVGIVDVHM